MQNNHTGNIQSHCKKSYFIGPSNPGHNGFVLLYSTKTIQTTFFVPVTKELALKSAPAEIIEPYLALNVFK